MCSSDLMRHQLLPLTRRESGGLIHQLHEFARSYHRLHRPKTLGPRSQSERPVVHQVSPSLLNANCAFLLWGDHLRGRAPTNGRMPDFRGYRLERHHKNDGRTALADALGDSARRDPAPVLPKRYGFPSDFLRK